MHDEWFARGYWPEPYDYIAEGYFPQAPGGIPVPILVGGGGLAPETWRPIWDEEEELLALLL